VRPTVFGKPVFPEAVLEGRGFKPNFSVKGQSSYFCFVYFLPLPVTRFGRAYFLRLKCFGFIFLPAGKCPVRRQARGTPSAALRPYTRGKKYSAGELPLGDCSKCRELREKKIKNFLLPFSGPLTFCGKTPPLYPKAQRWVIDSPRLLKSLPRFIV
jgi:hypothetical protein